MRGEPKDDSQPAVGGRRERPGHLSPIARPDPDALELTLEIRDPDVLAELRRRPGPREREAFALAALRVGTLALRSAEGQVDGATVRAEVERMLRGLEEGLTHHREALGGLLAGTLREYFDPRDGRFAERVEALVRDDGELARLLRGHVEGEGSSLARTLAGHLGAESPLLRRLDPERSDGLLASLRGVVDEALSAQRERILAEFSLDNREGSLARLVAELREHHGELDEALKGRIDEVVAEFSLDDDASALSRLVARVEGASRRLSEEFSLDSETSALARLRRELMEVAGSQSERLAALEKSVAAELAALRARRESQAASPAHGRAFEEALVAWLRERSEAAGDRFEDTRNLPGLVRQRKTGDAVIQLGPEHQAAGARIAVEAKEEAGTTPARAAEELERARKNRGAEVGIFVLSRSVAPPEWRPFHRVGQDLFVVWDADDPRSDAYLEAGLSVARTLCARSRVDDHAALELSALDRAVRDVERQLEGLDEIVRASDSIEKGNERVRDRVRKMRRNLQRAVDALDAFGDAVRRELGPGDAGAG